MLKITLKKKEEMADKFLKEAEKKKQQIIEDAKEEARQTIREAKETSEEVRKELNKVKSTDNFADRNRIFEASNKRLKDSDKKYSANLIREEETNVTSPEEIEIGMRVKVLSINQNGEVVSLPDSRNEVKVKIGIMKISVPASDIRTIIESKSQKKARQKVSSYGNIYRSKSLSVSPSVTVRGQILDDALMDVEKYLDDAYIAGLKNVTIIHGVGEGVLKDGIRIELKRNKHVKSARAGKYNEGGQGVTIVELKEN